MHIPCIIYRRRVKYAYYKTWTEDNYEWSFSNNEAGSVRGIFYIIMIYSRRNEKNSRRNNRSTEPPEQDPGALTAALRRSAKQLQGVNFLPCPRDGADVLFYTPLHPSTPVDTVEHLIFITPLPCMKDTFSYVAPCNLVDKCPNFWGSQYTVYYLDSHNNYSLTYTY
jgi:hypothetical protein